MFSRVYEFLFFTFNKTMDLLTYDFYYYRILQQLESLKKIKLELLRHKSLELIKALPKLYGATHRVDQACTSYALRGEATRRETPYDAERIFFFAYIKHGRRTLEFNPEKTKPNEPPRRNM